MQEALVQHSTLKGGLPTRELLVRRGIIDSNAGNSCVLCIGAVESGVRCIVGWVCVCGATPIWIYCFWEDY